MIPAAAPTSEPTVRSWILRFAVPGLVLLALALACYWPALRGGFVWDDAAHVTRPDLRSWAGLARIWTEFGATQQYYPVAHTAFWLEHRLWGDATLGYHLANLLQHVLAAVLFAALLRRLWAGSGRAAASTDAGRFAGSVRKSGTGASAVCHTIYDKPRSAGAREERSREGRAVGGGSEVSPRRAPARMPRGIEWVAAALFVVHPVGVESVAWISEQKNTLSLVFYLLAAHAYLSFADTRRGRWYALATAAFVLALGTKTVTASLPAALLMVGWWRHGRLEWRRDVMPLLPWFVLAAAAGVLTITVERTFVGAGGVEFFATPWQRLFLAARNVAFYAGQLLWPADLVFIYPRWDLAEAWRWAGWLVALFALTAALWTMRRRARGPLAGWLFFVGSLFPALGFVNVYPFRFSYVADHFQYLPSLALFALAGWGAGWAWSRLARGGRIGLAASGWAAGAVLVMASQQQSRHYADTETLYRSVLARNPECWLAHNNLALELAGIPERVPEAIDHGLTAVRLKPDLPEARLNLGLALGRSGQFEPAVACYQEALRLRPKYPEAMHNLGITLRALGRMPEALAQLQAALALVPGDAETRNELGTTLAALGRATEARAEFEAAVRLAPDYAVARLNLAAVLARIDGHAREAIAHYRQALAIEPRQPVAHYNLALLLETQRDGDRDAATHYEEALRLNPAYAEAHNNLAVLLARRGELEQAETHWHEALKADPGFADAQRNLELLARERGTAR